MKNITKTAIATMVLGMAMLSPLQAKADTTKNLAVESEYAVTAIAGLTTQVNYPNVSTDENPGWVAVQSQNGKSGCLQNVDTYRVLCSNADSQQATVQVNR